MNELEWAKSVQRAVTAQLERAHPALSMRLGARLPYASEIVLYREDSPVKHDSISVSYETDLLVVEHVNKETWKPRVVIETKIAAVTTHDAITYSEKAFTHKRVHPYLRYGILLGKRQHHPLPGRLFRHGLYFDFMLSWTAELPTPREQKELMIVLLDEVEASRHLEEILYSSRRSNRKRYVVLHRPLLLR
jgi:hypothetical protein